MIVVICSIIWIDRNMGFKSMRKEIIGERYSSGTSQVYVSIKKIRMQSHVGFSESDKSSTAWGCKSCHLWLLYPTLPNHNSRQSWNCWYCTPHKKSQSLKQTWNAPNPKQRSPVLSEPHKIVTYISNYKWLGFNFESMLTHIHCTVY